MHLKSTLAYLFSVFALSIFQAHHTSYAENLNLQEQLYNIYDNYESAIVRVRAAFRQEEIEGKPSQINLRIGTGFFVSREGHVLVNSNRTLGADKIGIEYKEIVYAAESIGHDPITNISLLRLIKLPQSFGVIPLAFEKKYYSGELHFFISLPVGFDVTPILGILNGVIEKWELSYFQLLIIEHQYALVQERAARQYLILMAD